MVQELQSRYSALGRGGKDDLPWDEASEPAEPQPLEPSRKGGW